MSLFSDKEYSEIFILIFIYRKKKIIFYVFYAHCYDSLKDFMLPTLFVFTVRHFLREQPPDSNLYVCAFDILAKLVLAAPSAIAAISNPSWNTRKLSCSSLGDSGQSTCMVSTLPLKPKEKAILTT